MSYSVNKSLSAEENLYSLIQYTWPDVADLLTTDHIAVEGGIDIDGVTNRRKVVITGISDEVVGTKEATYEVNDLTIFNHDFAEVESAADAKAAVLAAVSTLTCLEEEIDVSDAVEVDGQYRVDIAAVPGAITVAGSKLLWVPKVFEPMDLATDLEGDVLDGFEQIHPT